MSFVLLDQISISFLPVLPVWMGYLGVGCLLLTFAYALTYSIKRIHKRNTLRRGLVAALNLVLFFTFAALLSDIQINRTGVNAAILVTTGADLKQVDSLIEELSLDNTVQHSTYLLADSELKNSATLTVANNQWLDIHHPEQLLMAQPQLQKLTVIGDGLSSQQWSALQSLSAVPGRLPLEIQFIPSSNRTGFTNMRWKKRLITGEKQKVSGTLSIAKADEIESLHRKVYQVSLIQPDGEVRATQNVKDGETFQFSFPASAQGQWLYSLSLKRADSPNPLIIEKIAFSVEQTIPPKILIVQSAPSFETKHFKNWASRFNAPITMQTQISQNKYITHHLNSALNGTGAEGLNSLPEFDLLIIDGRALLNLSADYLNTLSTAVSNGLGILVIADQTLLSQQHETHISFLDNLLIATKADEPNTNDRLLRWSQLQTSQPITYLNAILTTKNSLWKDNQALVTDTQNNPVVLSEYFGLGKVAISLINTSFQWQLSGEADLYSQYWQHIIAQISRSTSEPRWQPMSEDQVAYIANPLKLCALSNNDAHTASYQRTFSTSAVKQTRTLSLATSSPFDDKQCSVIWPESTGWYTAFLNDTDDNQMLVSQSSFYVYANQQWSSWQQSLKHSASKSQAQQSAKAPLKVYSEDLSKYPFWWLFIGLITLLWIERKF